MKNDLFSALKTDIQHALAVDTVRFQGEPALRLAKLDYGPVGNHYRRLEDDVRMLKSMVETSNEAHWSIAFIEPVDTTLPRADVVQQVFENQSVWRMCNPAMGVTALTPHEALSVIFAQLKARFDSVVLGAFIRMMGVYPPGSIVQLVNDRYAIVASVNSSRPLRPKVIVHDPRVPKEEAPILDLETVPELGIRRSLKPAQLPRDALDYLSPRQRICYFFERAVSPDPDEAAA